MTRPTKNILFLAIVGFLACLLIYVIGVSLLFSKISSVEEKQSLLAVVEKSATGKRELQRVIAETEADRARLLSATLTDDAIPDFISRLESFADKALVNLSVGSVNVASAKELTYHEFVTTRLTAQGSLTGVHHFLRLLETVPGMRIQEVHFDRTEDDKGVGIWRMAIDLSVPKLK